MNKTQQIVYPSVQLHAHRYYTIYKIISVDKFLCEYKYIVLLLLTRTWFLRQHCCSSISFMGNMLCLHVLNLLCGMTVDVILIAFG